MRPPLVSWILINTDANNRSLRDHVATNEAMWTDVADLDEA